MRPQARLQAAIEILDQVIEAAAHQGAAADTLVQRYFQTRRYAGSKDRAAVRELVYGAIRFTAERPLSGRAALIGWLEAEAPEQLALFDGGQRLDSALAARADAGGMATPDWQPVALPHTWNAADAFDMTATAAASRSAGWACRTPTTATRPPWLTAGSTASPCPAC